MAMRLTHTEFVDANGLTRAIYDVEQLVACTLTDKEAKSASFLRNYLVCVQAAYKPHALGKTLSLDCEYRQRDGYGRTYCKAPKGPNWAEDQSSSVCVQGMPSILRPYLVGPLVHDIDIVNAHPTLLYQLAKFFHLWPENKGKSVTPLITSMLEELVNNRDNFLNYIASFHCLPEDNEMFHGYRKDMCKTLVLRILYGGSYLFWLKENGFGTYSVSKRIVALEAEVCQLRMALLASERYSEVVCREKARGVLSGKSDDAVSRSTFSKIAQQLEHQVLSSMRDYLMCNGWTVHSLIFDGLTVGHDDNRNVGDVLSSMCEYIELDTQFVVRIAEKPLFGVEPVLELQKVRVA